MIIFKILILAIKTILGGLLLYALMFSIVYFTRYIYDKIVLNIRLRKKFSNKNWDYEKTKRKKNDYPLGY